MRSKAKLMTPIEKLVNNNEFHKTRFDRLQKKDIRSFDAYYNICSIYCVLSYELFVKKDFQQTKQYCFSIAKTIELFNFHYCTSPDDGKIETIEHYFSNTFALLSDKIDLVRKFQHFDYSMRNKYGDNKEENRQYFIEKQGFMWGYAMQCIINEDFVALNRIIDAAKELHKKTANKSRHYDVHWAVWEAIRDRDLEGIERTIHALIKNSRTFNDNIWGEYISLPATGYLKAAWIIGLEVEIKHKLIPMEMMPVRPLKIYKNDFDFFLPNNPELSSLIGSLLRRQ